jgi:hypothetical protein
MIEHKQAAELVQPIEKWRFTLGLIVFIVGFLSPLLIPLVKAAKLSAGWKVFISGALAVGIPEVFSVAAIAIMGKSGFNAIKDFIFKLFKKYGPPDVVGPTRYRIGLVMFVLPILFGWLAPYAPHLIPGYATHRMVFNLMGDLILISSLFVLGGDFWDKVRSLFIHGAKASFPFRG